MVDTRYATDGEAVYFEINGEIFICDPKLFLASSFFSMLLRNCRGTREEPISIDGVTAEEFSVFASLLHGRETPTDTQGLDQERWKIIYRLSELWRFQLIRQLALANLQQPGDADTNPLSDFVEGPVDGVAKILQGMGTGLAVGVGGAVLLPFAIASLPFVGIHKGIQWSRGKK
ncbi:hypothetical protein FRB95_003685 [Tulasnella sp. JGI-2019a]|nr:hypothetical protein FRB93_009993 [Tulasnella sp. JGI-2019a]KAG9037848.1 hypothetical protein FRB95_003685 [Tulasnella sp. JGI-2019a]